jgi:hypothetical protein
MNTRITVTRLLIVAMLVVLAMVGRNSAQTNTTGVTSKQKAAGAPADTKALAGNYYRGDGLGYNVTLVLRESGEYSSEWHGCLGKYGEAAGKWKLQGERVTFTPSTEKDMMVGHLKTLDVVKIDGEWILVPTDKEDRKFFDEHGASRFTCFQKAKKANP